MQTPGMLILSNMAHGAVENLVQYAQMAEARGLRNFLVSESMTDSLGVGPTYRQCNLAHSSRNGDY